MVRPSRDGCGGADRRRPGRGRAGAGALARRGAASGAWAATAPPPAGWRPAARRPAPWPRAAWPATSARSAGTRRPSRWTGSRSPPRPTPRRAPTRSSAWSPTPSAGTTSTSPGTAWGPPPSRSLRSQAVTQRGGHVSGSAGSPRRPRCWAATRDGRRGWPRCAPNFTCRHGVPTRGEIQRSSSASRWTPPVHPMRRHGYSGRRQHGAIRLDLFPLLPPHVHRACRNPAGPRAGSGRARTGQGADAAQSIREDPARASELWLGCRTDHAFVPSPGRRNCLGRASPYITRTVYSHGGVVHHGG